MALNTLPEDVLIHIFKFLEAPEILYLRETSRRLYDISTLRIVWVNACKSSIFPSQEGCDPELHTCQSHHIASKWRAQKLDPRTQIEFTATHSTAITEVHFVGHNWILTVSNAIWSVLSIWDWKAGGRKCSEWSPAGVVFNGPLAFNSEKGADTFAALLTTHINGPQRVVFLAVDNHGQLKSTHELETTLRPVALRGTRLALCDNVHTTVIYDTTLETMSQLDSSLIHVVDHCIDVVFITAHVLVVRARSITLFEYPSCTPVAAHSFGWVDGASVAYDPLSHVISILVRTQSDNPWTDDVNALELYRIFPSKDCLGYCFPPVAASGISSRRGALRCPEVALGRFGTAIWISPQELSMIVDDPSDLLAKETLVAAAFPGPLNEEDRVKVLTILTNNLNDWTALDYDEERGCIALGSSIGKVMVLQL